MELSNQRCISWTPPGRPDWVMKINDEGKHLDIKSIVPLDSSSLIAAAVSNTGLSDFGSDDWREPFELICRGLDDEADLNLMGRIMTRSDMLMLLEGRLQVEDAYRRHPEIEDEQIIAPILITGQGRTGTSAMINLLAADPDNAVMRTWQAMFPGLPPAHTGEDPRIAIADARMRMWSRVTPEMDAIHEWTADVPTESIHVYCLSFQMPAWQNIYGQSPSHTAYMATRSKVNAVAYEKRVLKLQQWRQPKRQWVLKSPDSLNYMPDVLQVYPDIQLVWMHRDPIVALSSAVNLVGTLAWARSDRIIPAGTFGAVADPVSSSHMLTKPIDWLESGLISKNVLHSTQYDDFINDPLSVVRGIYQFAGREISPAGLQGMQAYINRHPRTSRPAHRYATGEADMVAAERKAFQRYQEYFNVPSEI